MCNKYGAEADGAFKTEKMANSTWSSAYKSLKPPLLLVVRHLSSATEQLKENYVY